MRIFNSTSAQDTSDKAVDRKLSKKGMKFDNEDKGTPSKSGDRKIVKREKPQFNAEEIRTKMKAREDKKIEAEKKVIENKASMTDKEADEKAVTLGTVAVNDPKDPGTRSKLKDVLVSGAFKFSEKEQAALSQILNKE